MSVFALKMITGTVGACCLISRHTSSPGIPGNRRSRTTADGTEERNASRPALPSVVSSTVKSSDSKRRWSTFWADRSSSTTSIFFIEGFFQEVLKQVMVHIYAKRDE